MRKGYFFILLAIIIIMVLTIVPVAMAETTGGAGWDNDLECLNEGRDYLVGHDHDYIDNNTQSVKRWRVELGTDIIVQERTEGQNNLWPLQTQFQGRYDFNNRVGGVAIVATYHLKDIWKGVVDMRDDIRDVVPGI